jgi:hypothetical protein
LLAEARSERADTAISSNARRATPSVSASSESESWRATFGENAAQSLVASGKSS